jgi:predicted nuclease of predicted toxin-antitoxin system
MSTLRLYLDEDVWHGLATVLRQYGYDVIHTHEINANGRGDSEQLAFAAAEERAILTHNARDFVPLAINYYALNRKHYGVILSQQIAKGELVRRTLRLLETLSAEDAMNTMRYLSDFR